ncbi:MAG: glycoside hydrolase family 10 protein [Brevinemataceae bacterium]
MLKKYVCLFLFIPAVLFGGSPKRELRAAWIATVFNIDWPSQSGLPAELQQKELINILDRLQEMKFNAAILQVKPSSDAFYQSKLSPWSRYLTGTQGIHPGYDPLKFFIAEARKRNIETHIWVNPFRVSNGEGLDQLSGMHMAVKNPDWLIRYNNRYYFDPGNPKVQEYIIQEISEIVKSYDLDALHMDDYFYPYKVIQNKVVIPFGDDDSWRKYGQNNFRDRDEWRRNNIDHFVFTLSRKIKKIKPCVQFGISPFGVWRNKSEDLRGSDTKAGQTNYDDLYADVLKWIENRWIDYVMPQIYWHFDTKTAPFDVLVSWWEKYTRNKVNLFIGIGVYKLKEQNWPTEYISSQVDFIRKHPHVNGVAFYSAKWLVNDTKNIKSLMRNSIHKNYALPPINKTVSASKPKSPDRMKLINKQDGTTFQWENADIKNTQYFVLYQFESDNTNQDNARHILGMVSAQDELQFTVPEYRADRLYGITAVSRFHEESLIRFFDNKSTKSSMIADILDGLTVDGVDESANVALISESDS